MQLLIDHTSEPAPVGAIILAHGAGAPMDSGFMNDLTQSLNCQGVSVFRFEFPYMAERRKPEGKKKPPNRQPILLDAWQEAFHRASEEWDRDLPLLIGGKSMGGRMATLVADIIETVAVCCYGYPFHAPGRKDKMRTAHFATLQKPVLIMQGTRDSFGKQEEINPLSLGRNVQIEWLASGDHDLKPLKKTGKIQLDLIEVAALKTAGFIRKVS